MNDRKNVQQFVIAWNTIYPLDKWWRDKYKIAFNSQAHRDTTQIDIAIEYIESLLFAKSRQKQQDDQDDDKYIPGQGLRFVSLPDQSADIDSLFERFSGDSLKIFDDNG